MNSIVLIVGGTAAMAAGAALAYAGVWCKNPDPAYYPLEKGELERLQLLRRRNTIKSGGAGNTPLTDEEQKELEKLEYRLDKTTSPRSRGGMIASFLTSPLFLLGGLILMLLGAVKIGMGDVDAHISGAVSAQVADVKKTHAGLGNWIDKTDPIIKRQDESIGGLRGSVEEIKKSVTDGFKGLRDNFKGLMDRVTASEQWQKKTDERLAALESPKEHPAFDTNIMVHVAKAAVKAELQPFVETQQKADARLSKLEESSNNASNMLAKLLSAQPDPNQDPARMLQALRSNASGVPTVTAPASGVKPADTLPARVAATAGSMAQVDMPQVIPATALNTNTWKSGLTLQGNQVRRFAIGKGLGDGKKQWVKVDYILYMLLQKDMPNGVVEAAMVEAINRFHAVRGVDFAEKAKRLVGNEAPLNYLEAVRPYVNEVLKSHNLSDSITFVGADYRFL